MPLMETLRRIGPLVPGLLLLGASLSLFSMFAFVDSTSWFPYIFWGVGILSLIFGTVVFGIQLIELTPTWLLSGLIMLVSALFLACAYSWALPVEDDLLVIHPSGIPLMFSIIWFVLATVTAFRTLKQRAFSTL